MGGGFKFGSTGGGQSIRVRDVVRVDRGGQSVRVRDVVRVNRGGQSVRVREVLLTEVSGLAFISGRVTDSRAGGWIDSA